MTSWLTPAAPKSFLPKGTTDAVMRRIDPKPNPLAMDPIKWAKERGIFWWSVQRQIAESVRDNRYTAVQSCHGMGKSFTAASVIAHWIDTHPPHETFVVWTAPRWQQVQKIVGRELRALHAKLNLPGRITLDCQIYGPNDIELGYGRKPADTDAHGFQGIHAKYVLVVVDEACGVPPALWTAIESLVTNAHCRVLCIGNPDDPAAEFAKVCADDSYYNVIKVSAFDTPNFTGEYIPEKLKSLLVDEQWVEERKARWGTSSMLYVSKVLGRFPKVSKDTLFPPGLILRMQNLELPGLGKGKYGLDVSRYGSDKTVLYRNRDGVIRLVAWWEQMSIPDTAEVVEQELREHPYVPISVDTIGLGGGVHDLLVKHGFPSHEFDAGGKASDPDRYVNQRAEAYWSMAQAAKADEIDLDPEDLDLAADLMAIKYKIVNKRIQIESKDDIKRRLDGRSPDNADGAVIAWWKGPNQWDAQAFRAAQGAALAKGGSQPAGLTDHLLNRSM